MKNLLAVILAISLAANGGTVNAAQASRSFNRFARALARALPLVKTNTPRLAQTIRCISQTVPVSIPYNFQEQQINDLFAAIEQRNVSGVTKLINGGANVNARDKAGNTPLHFAAEYATSACTKALIDAGADVRTRNNSGLTPLHYVAAYDGVAKVEMLLIAGADINAGALTKAVDRIPVYDNNGKILHYLTVRLYGKTPLDCAEERGNHAVAALLRERGALTAEEMRAAGILQS